MGHNSPQYIHTVTQTIDLAMADRDAYIGDPPFVNVPLDTLLSKDFADARRAAMANNAFASLPEAGLLPTPSGGSGSESFSGRCRHCFR